MTPRRGRAARLPRATRSTTRGSCAGRSSSRRRRARSATRQRLYRTSEAYLYNLTAFAMTGTKAPYLDAVLRSVAAPGARVLDVGCGIGSDGLALLEAGLRGRVRRLRQPEHALPALAAGAARAERADPRPRRAARCPTGFDLAYAFDVLEHVDDPVALLDAMERAARARVRQPAARPAPDETVLHRALPVGDDRRARARGAGCATTLDRRARTARLRVRLLVVRRGWSAPGGPPEVRDPQDDPRGAPSSAAAGGARPTWLNRPSSSTRAVASATRATRASDLARRRRPRRRRQPRFSPTNQRPRRVTPACVERLGERVAARVVGEGLARRRCGAPCRSPSGAGRRSSAARGTPARARTWPIRQCIARRWMRWWASTSSSPRHAPAGGSSGSSSSWRGRAGAASASATSSAAARP